MSDRAMRREPIFSGQGAYDALVAGNALFHREAAARIGERIGELLARRDSHAALRVLDLACGGTPVSIAAAMERYPDRRFEYLGVDINADQLERARRFRFAPNVATVDLHEGSAWELDPDLQDGAPYDLVFVGLNWHHGTPEEIGYAARQVARLLAPDGWLLNHDCLRPEGSYLRRPDVGPAGEDLRLVAPERLRRALVPDLDLAEADPDDPAPPWRSELIDLLESAFRQAGGGDADARALVAHSWARDYPISGPELLAVLGHAGLDAELQPYTGTDLARFLGFVAARRTATAVRPERDRTVPAP